MRYAIRLAAVALAVCCVFAVDAAPPAGHVHTVGPDPDPAAATSLFQLDVHLDPAGGGQRALAALAGRPSLVALFYSSCTSVCPMLILEMQRLEAALDPADRQRVAFVMVSLDAERDTPEALAAFATEHHMDGSNWLVAHATASDVRVLAAALGVRYRQLPDRSFSHSSLITLLDSHGVPRDRLPVPARDQTAFLAALGEQLGRLPRDH